MKSKKRRVIGVISIAIMLLFSTIYLPHYSMQKKQAELYLKPLIKEANMLSFYIQDVTDKRDNHISSELDAVNEQFVPDEISFLNTLDHSLCVLVDDLQNENGILSGSNTRQYSDAITAFTETMREA